MIETTQSITEDKILQAFMKNKAFFKEEAFEILFSNGKTNKNAGKKKAGKVKVKTAEKLAVEKKKIAEQRKIVEKVVEKAFTKAKNIRVEMSGIYHSANGLLSHCVEVEALKEKFLTTFSKAEKYFQVVAFNVVGDEDAAKDVILGEFLKIWQGDVLKLKPIRNIKSYFTVCVRNEAKKAKKKLAKKKAEENDAVEIYHLNSEDQPRMLSRFEVREILKEEDETKDQMLLDFLLSTVEEVTSTELQLKAIILWAHGHTNEDIADEMNSLKTPEELEKSKSTKSSVGTMISKIRKRFPKIKKSVRKKVAM